MFRMYTIAKATTIWKGFLAPSFSHDAIPCSCIVNVSRFKCEFVKPEFPNDPIPKQASYKKFNVVFSLPFIKILSVFNRLKLYHFIGTAAGVPSAAALEFMTLVPQSSFMTALYIGVTGGVLLSGFSLPFRNTIGFIYISDDNKLIKISYLDFWGRRKERIVPVEEWTPLSDLPKSNFDVFFLKPTLADGTKYKLFVRYGYIYSPEKMSCILE